MKVFGLACVLWGITLFGITAVYAQPPDILWSRSLGPGECRSIRQTSDEGYILASKGRLIKTDSNGDVIWSHLFCGFDGCESVQQTSDGGYIVAGWDEWLYHTLYFFGQTAKTDSNGEIEWSHCYADGVFGSGAHFYSVQQTSDGGFISAGSASRFHHYDLPNFWLVKTDAVGDCVWTRVFGGSDYDVCHSVRQTDDGGFIAAGYTDSFGSGGTDFWLLKTNADGDSLWSRTFGGWASDNCYSVQQTPDGGYILAGLTSSFGAGGYDFWLVRTDTNGDSLWSRTFGGIENDICRCVELTSDSGFITAGYTHSFGAGDYDFWLVKVEDDGDSVWSCTFGCAGEDICYSAQQTADNGYILAGYGWGSNIWLVKTGPELGVEPREELLPEEYVLYQNYPNPFNPSTRISYDLTRTGQVTLTVYDVLGREVVTLVDGIQATGNHTAIFNGSDLASGIYFYRLQVGDFVSTKKMVLLK